MVEKSKIFRIVVAGTVIGSLYEFMKCIAKKRLEDRNLDNDNPYIRGVRKNISTDSTIDGTAYERKVKPVIDKALSFCGLVLLSPLYFVIGIIIYLDDPGPVFFIQKRVGKDKKFFELHKFRTMLLNTPHDVPTHQLENPEQYLTKIGRFLRRTSLDELPQIWDIFRGRMSIIGPRPALWNQEDLIEEREQYGANSILPGLTGWAQINGRDELEIVDKARLDGEYVKRLRQRGLKAFFFDVRCFIGTISSILKHEGVVEGGTGEINRNTNSDSKKSILVVCQYYYPEPFRISDLCEELVKRGHEVMVLTGEPNYPEGERYEGYDHGQRTDETINGVRVHRCFTIPRKSGNMKRLLNYFSYGVSSTAYVNSGRCLTKGGKPFDVVFCNQLSPVMMAESAIAYKKKYGVPLILYCLDIWPESLVAGGVNRGSMIYKVFHKISKRIYRSVDKIIVSSRMFTDYLYEQFGVKKESIIYLPQYAEELFEPLPAKEENGYIDLMFAGNIGGIQSLDTVIEAAKELQDEKIRFHIVGGGTDLERLQRMVKNKRLSNVVFYGRKSLEEMPEMYEKADAMLITLKADPVISLTLPGKVQTYMACGKPIIGAVDGETADVINEAGCGYCGPAENSMELVTNIRRFVFSDERIEMGRKARDFYDKNYQKNEFIREFEMLIRTMCNKK